MERDKKLQMQRIKHNNKISKSAPKASNLLNGVNATVRGGAGKGKVHPTICHEGTDGEYRYRSTLSLTSALDGGGRLTPRPSHHIPGMRPGTHHTECKYNACMVSTDFDIKNASRQLMVIKEEDTFMANHIHMNTFTAETTQVTTKLMKHELPNTLTLFFRTCRNLQVVSFLNYPKTTLL
jgi:hypothetical protein